MNSGRVERKIKLSQEKGDSLKSDRFEQVRESLWGTPGFQRRNSTIISSGFSFLPQATWIIETIKTDDNYAIFLQMIDKEGGQRLVLPQKVCNAIYNQERSIMKKRRSERSKKVANIRKQRGDTFFGNRNLAPAVSQL